MERIAGRTAFISGGASGIGLGIAKELIAAGARVILADIDEAELSSAVARLGEPAFGVPLDVTDRAGWGRAKAAGEDRFGPVDILVNNAGIASDGHTLADMDPNAFDRVIRINLTGVFNGVSTFAAAMRDRGDGHILNTASHAGHSVRALLGSYSAAKFGVVGMTEVLRIEMEPHGVGVSALCPGLVRTRLGETTIAAGSDRVGLDHSLFEAGMDPALVARRAVEGIRDNSLHIFTHAEMREAVEDRMNAVLSAYASVAPS